jgi:hypothetical protein
MALVNNFLTDFCFFDNKEGCGMENIYGRQFVDIL